MSFIRRLSVPFQNWSPRPVRAARSDDLDPRIKDNIFRYQLDSPDFSHITQETLSCADVVNNKTYAEKVLKACHKIGIIDPGTGRPDTAKIDRNMVKGMPMISVEKQRSLVMFLFFWEEEITRWRLLSAEEDEIRKTLESGAEGGRQGLSEGYRIELEEHLRVVQARKRVMPSLRDESGRVVQSEEEEQLPSYEEARRQRSI